MTQIPAPSGDLSTNPDKYTQKAPDYTSIHAEHRVLHITTSWMKYGTDDKGHAAALILSCLLLAMIALLFVAGLFARDQAAWIGTTLGLLGNGFLFTSGIAVGKGKSQKADD